MLGLGELFIAFQTYEVSIANRNARRILLIPVPGGASAGQAVVILLYSIVTIVLIFVDMPVGRGPDVYANRTGWYVTALQVYFEYILCWWASRWISMFCRG